MAAMPPVVMKYDGEKNRLDLIPTSMITAVGQVLTYGAKKYKDRGWEAGMEWNRAYGAALRHMTAFWNGEDRDPETGLPHLAHALCEIAFLLEYMTTHPELDNRPKYISPKPLSDYASLTPEERLKWTQNPRPLPLARDYEHDIRALNPQHIPLSARATPAFIRHDNGGNPI